jgi:hypothetical protein
MKKEQLEIAQRAIARAVGHSAWLDVVQFGLDQLLTEPVFLLEQVLQEAKKMRRSEACEQTSVFFDTVMKELGLNFSLVACSAPVAENRACAASAPQVKTQKPEANFDGLSAEDAAIMAYEVPPKAIVRAMGTREREQHDIIMRKRARIKERAPSKERYHNDPALRERKKAYKRAWSRRKSAEKKAALGLITPQQLQAVVTAIKGKSKSCLVS